MDQNEDRRISVADLVEYARKGEEEMVISFLKQQPNIMKQKNFNNLVTAVVEEEREDVLVWLLNSGFNKNAALDIVINNGSERIINLLLDQGADKDEGLYFAVKANKSEPMAILLARGANINTNKRNGNTPLHVAITLKCNVSVIQFLIDNGADTNARTRNNKTALELINNTLPDKINDFTKDKLKEIKNLLKLNELNDDVFECLQGLPDGLSGYSYQIKLFTLYAIVNTKLAISSDCKYELGTEVTDLVPFDDIYSKIIQDGRTSCHFVQVKQTKKPDLNKIKESDFFTMLKSGENIKEHVKGNGTILKMFMKFGEICSRRLEKGDDVEFIYCTNTDFKNSMCYLFEPKNKDDLLCGVGGVKWQIVDWRYLDIEIKFVLLNLIKSSKYINLLDDGLKNKINKQIKILDHFKFEKVSEKHEECGLWSISKIAKVGVNINNTYLEFYKMVKAKITVAKNVESVNNDIPDECELPNYTGELSSIINSAIAKIDEIVKGLKSEKGLFMHFSENDDSAMLDKINNFIKHFSIYTACPTSDQLDDIITKELSEEFKLHKSKLLSFYCVQFFNKWISDFKNKLGILFKHKDGKQLFRDLRLQIFKGFGKSYTENLLSHNIHFRNDNKSVVDFLNKNNTNKILQVVTEYPHLHTLKVLQTLKSIEKNIVDMNNDNILFTNSEILFNSGDTVNYFFEVFSSTNSVGDLLVIELSNYLKDHSNICKQFRNFAKNPRKRIIVIGNKHNKIATTLEDMLKEHIITCTDRIAFKDLSEETQADILEKTVNFKNDPNSPDTLKKIKDFLTASVACEVIDEEMLSLIINNSESIQIGDDKPFYSDVYIKEYYIPRRIHPQMIDKWILRYFHHYLFFITGITKNELLTKVFCRNSQSHFIRYKIKKLIHVWREDMCFNNGIIVIPEEEINITNKEIFQHISNACGKNINWLEFRDELLFLKATKINSKEEPRPLLEVSDMDEIQLEKYSLNPESLVQKIVILANNPGEGKSTMLTDLSYAIKEKHSDLWIVRVDLKDYVDVQTPTSLNNINFSYEETAKALNTIIRMVVNGDDSNINIKFERILLEASLNACASIKVVLFIDGFDEISPDYKEKSCNLLKALKNSNVQQMWITTRVHRKEFLEEELEESAHVLNPLTKKEQIVFLNKHWKWNLKNYKAAEYETEEQICKQIVSSLRTCYDNYSRQTSRPHDLDSLVEIIEEVRDYSLKSLQQTIDDKLDMSICAEVFLEKWQSTLRYEHAFFEVPLNLKMLSEHLYKNNWQIDNLKNLGTFEIYKQVIEFKIKIYRENKSTTQSGNPADRELADLASTLIRKLHREVAVKTLFPNSKFLPELNITNEYYNKNNTNEIITRLGLLKSSEDSINFVHRSYAEYFFSEYLWIHLDNPSVQSELLTDVLINVQYQLVRTFLDGFLSQTESKPCSPKVLMEIMKMQNVHKETIMHVVSIERHKHIRAYVLNSFERHNKTVDFLLKFEKEAPTVAEVEPWTDNEEIYDIIMEKIKKYPDVLKDKQGLIVFNSAAIVKNREVRDVIRKTAIEHHHALKDMLLNRTYRGTTSLHEAVINKRVDVCKHIMTTVQNHFDDFKSVIFSCDSEMHSAMTSAVTLDLQDKDDYGISQSSKKEICDIMLTVIRARWDIVKNFKQKSYVEDSIALHVAVFNENIKICRDILKTIKSSKYLYLFKDLINTCQEEGLRALHIMMIDEITGITDIILTTHKEHYNNLKELIMKAADYKALVNTYPVFVKKKHCDIVYDNVEKIKELIMTCKENGHTTIHVAPVSFVAPVSIDKRKANKYPTGNTEISRGRVMSAFQCNYL